MEEVSMTLPPAPKELDTLVTRCLAQKPAQSDLAALREYSLSHPGMVGEYLGLAQQTQGKLIKGVTEQEVMKIGINAELATLRRGLNYDQASQLERLIIQNIENCWLRLQWVEYQLAGRMGADSAAESIELWEKRLSISQKRFLRACESLARVRRMTSPTTQVNIAQSGAQQLNVSGDLLKSRLLTQPTPDIERNLK
jgi:hypothetical protein